jgi:glycosyltransferase involved in cell wall biosynthesis
VFHDNRLLLISTTSKIGGTERIVLTLAQGMGPRGANVQTVLAADDGAESTVDWFGRNGVTAVASPAVLTVYKPHTSRALLDLRRLVRQRGASTVNLHYGGNHLSIKDVIAVRSAGVRRCVVSIHHTNPVEDPRHRAMTRLGAQLIDAIVVTTNVAKEIMLGVGVPERKIHVISPCVERPKHKVSRADARAKLGLSQGAFVISTLARLTPEKGIADLIEGVARVPDSHTPIEVVIAGEGPARAELEALAQSRLKGRVRFTGHLPETNDVYAAADLFALPSHMEGFGLVYLEAALYGVPSLGTAVGGIPYAVQEGVTGVLVPLKSIDSISSAIRTMRDDPELRSSMGRAARERAERAFSPATMCDHYARVLFPG